MKRIIVRLPDDLHARLSHEAARRGVTIGEVTREAIEAHVGFRVLIAAKAGRSGTRNTARRIEEILRKNTRGRADG